MLRVACIICLIALLTGSGMAGLPTDSSIKPEARDLGFPDMHSPRLDEMAARAGRPPWAPLPVMWGHSEMVPMLVQLVRQGSPQDRIRAAFLLGEIGDRAATRSLLNALDDPWRDVRIQAGIALACLGDERGQHAAWAALIGEPQWIRYYAVLGLSRLNTDRIRQNLRQIQPQQPEFISRTIQAALDQPAPVVAAATDRQPVALERDQIAVLWDWGTVVDAFNAETDWWWHHGDYDQCIRCMQVMLLMDPTPAETYSNIAWLQWSMGDDTRAIGTYHRVISTLPEDPWSHHYLGRHYFMTKRYELAIPYLRKAIELQPGIISRHLLAHCLERTGQVEACFEHWREMYEQTPDDPAVKFNYERCLRHYHRILHRSRRASLHLRCLVRGLARVRQGPRQSQRVPLQKSPAKLLAE